MLEIDASQGEGGGQILRSCLTLSLLSGQAVRLSGIRARRGQPGLRPQHLKAVEAARATGAASVAGAEIGARSLVFEPQGIRPGRFRFEIGTAGSTSLVLQTVLLPLSCGETASFVTLTGGTHVPWSPCFHYLERHWLLYLRKLGLDTELGLDSAGFYPRGGGCIHAEIRPARDLVPLRIKERGALQRIVGVSAVANLPDHVAERQRHQARTRLERRGHPATLECVRLRAPSRGSMLLLVAEFERSQCCYFALGARGKPAERVGDEAVDQLEEFLATPGAVEPYLADQLLLPLACVRGVSELATSKVTGHLLTNAAVIRRFLGTAIEIRGALGQPGFVRVEGTGLPGPERARDSE